jgi:hypothetical protein
MLSPFQTRAWLSGLVCSLTLSAAGLAAADTADSEADAERLFQEGRALLQAGDYQEACPRLERSQALAPATGTLLGLAICNEGAGRYATAWRQYQEVIERLAREGRPDRERVARARAARIEPLFSTLALAPNRAALEIGGFELWLDGALLRDWAAPIPVEPGAHSVEARRAGSSPQSLTIVVGTAAEHRLVAVPDFPASSAPPVAKQPSASVDSRIAPAALSASTQRARPVHSSSVDSRALQSRRAAWRTATWISAGVGVAALSSAGVLGTAAWLKREDLGCPDDRCRRDQQASVRNYMGLRSASTASLIGGALMLSTSLVLWLTLPNSRFAAFPSSTELALGF